MMPMGVQSTLAAAILHQASRSQMFQRPGTDACGLLCCVLDMLASARQDSELPRSPVKLAASECCGVDEAFSSNSEEVGAEGNLARRESGGGPVSVVRASSTMLCLSLGGCLAKS